MAKIKICGLTRIQDIEAVNKFLPDFVGFVFAESRRKLDPAQAAELKSRLDDRISAVGVFVNDGTEKIIRLCREGTIKLVQLHGDEDGAYIEKLRNELPNPIIKAVRAQNPDQILEAQELPCDYLLLDAYKRNLYGGTGECFDWSVIPELKKPFFLAGGLNAENIRKAAVLHPYCLDVSSGAETDGVKDIEKIKKIIKIIREEY